MRARGCNFQHQQKQNNGRKERDQLFLEAVVREIAALTDSCWMEVDACWASNCLRHIRKRNFHRSSFPQDCPTISASMCNEAECRRAWWLSSFELAALDSDEHNGECRNALLSLADDKLNLAAAAYTVVAAAVAAAAGGSLVHSLDPKACRC